MDILNNVSKFYLSPRFNLTLNLPTNFIVNGGAKMNKYEELLTELENKIGSDNFWNYEENIVEELSKYYSADELLIPVFQLMEKYPLIDWGMPGAFVHLLESASNNLYSQYLLESLNRQPTMHTVWMLNRQLNAVDELEKSKYITAMQDIVDNNDLPDEIRNSAKSFLDYQNKNVSNVSSGSSSMSLSDIFNTFTLIHKKKK